MKHSHLVRSAVEMLGPGCVVLRASHTRNLRWANSALTTNGDTSTDSMTVIAIDATDPARLGVTSGPVVDENAVADLVRQALDAAARATPVDAVPLLDGREEAGFDDEFATVGDPSTASMMEATAQLLAQSHPQFGYAELDATTTYLATSTGTRTRHVQETVRFEASARTDRASTWWGTNDLDADIAHVTAEQSQRLTLQDTRADLPAGRHRVILTPSAVADLLIYLAWSANARDAVEGHSVFAKPGGGTRVGEKLTARDIRLFADPEYPGLRTSPQVVVEANSSMESVFDNGFPLTSVDLIAEGRLCTLRASRPTAQRFDVPTTYLADNLILTDAAGHGDLEDLVARTDDAVLINCLWYIRAVDPQNLLLTGLTRDGVYQVKDGELVASLPNFRFNVSVTDVLSRILDASATTRCLPREWADWFTRTSMPALLVDDFNLSSTSDAM